MKRIILLLSFLSVIISCDTAQSSHKNSPKEKTSKELAELVSIMQGNYTSEKQSKIDKSYYNITLTMCPIWKDRGHYIYVEQALSKKLDKPYRMRVYRLFQQSETEFVCEIYTLKREKDWIGKWRTPADLERLTKRGIEIKEGCEINFTRAGLNKFMGQTEEQTCPSELKGASYATTKVNVYQNKIVSWDQGFNSGKRQVWGPEKGGYVFDKKKFIKIK
jgi:CpeT protein